MSSPQELFELNHPDDLTRLDITQLSNSQIMRIYGLFPHWLESQDGSTMKQALGEQMIRNARTNEGLPPDGDIR